MLCLKHNICSRDIRTEHEWTVNPYNAGLEFRVQTSLFVKKNYPKTSSNHFSWLHMLSAS